MRILLIVILITIGCEREPREQNNSGANKHSIDDARDDFDFFIGKWRIKNKVLKQRLAESNEWDEFDATTQVHEMEGLGNYDEFNSKLSNAQSLYGVSIRIYNPNLKEWTIYWADNLHPELGLTEQVHGSFNNGVGTFLGREVFNEDTVQLRFIWKVSEKRPYWEQAYYDEKNQVWETNWIMEFEPLGSETIDEAPSASNDFDFLIGDWKINNSILKERLSGSSKWVSQEGYSSITKAINGYCVIDQFHADTYYGLGIKLYDDKANIWRVYWLDNQILELKPTPQVVGNFSNGRSNFLGKEIIKSDSINMRFEWREIQQNTFTWEQSYFDKSNDKWEVNWISKYERSSQ
jgi:hypothetical protein